MIKCLNLFPYPIVTQIIISFFSYSFCLVGVGFINFVFCNASKMSTIKYIKTKKPQCLVCLNVISVLKEYN